MITAITQGTDADYLAWIRTKSCCAPRLGVCGGDVVAAHVRRIANGAGTGIKPPYSAVPLCDKHHKEQHQYGESAVGGKEYLDKKRGEFVTEWAKGKLKQILGVESLKDALPDLVYAWAESVDLVKYLPSVFK